MKLLSTFWVMLRTLISTLIASLKTLWFAKFVNKPRLRINAAARIWSQRLLDIVKLTYTVYNPDSVSFTEGKRYIVMSNHASHYDIPLIFMAFPGSIRMITKKELMQVPIWGHAMKASEFISVDRNNRQQAIKDMEKAAELMKSGVIPWVAPEGTRTRSGKIMAFKKGAFMLAIETGANIIPVGIRNSGAVLPPKTWQFSIGEHAEVHIGKPIDASNYTVEQRNELIERVRTEIAELAQVEME